MAVRKRVWKTSAGETARRGSLTTPIRQVTGTSRHSPRRKKPTLATMPSGSRCPEGRPRRREQKHHRRGGRQELVG